MPTEKDSPTGGTGAPSAITEALDSTSDNGLSLQIDVSKVLELIDGKQTQYYTLWGVYTAVQFAASGYGSGTSLSLGVGLAVLFGVWAFNLGHLGFVLRCVTQLNKLSSILDAALDENKEQYSTVLRETLRGYAHVGYGVEILSGRKLKSHYNNVFVHVFIDICASIALLIRIDSPWIRDPVPMFVDVSHLAFNL
jgi:hypothetical protein